MGQRLKFYGWGIRGRGPRYAERERLFRFVSDRLGVEPRLSAPPQASDIALRAPRVVAPAALAGLLTHEPYERLLHTYGKSYPETVRAFARDFANAPDLVALPKSEADIAAVLDWAGGAKVAVIPFGGGSSVVGGVEPAVGDSYAGAVSLDMRHFDRVLEVDATSRAARIQGGILGPAIEAALSRTASPSATIRRASSSRPSAAGSRPARAATSPPSIPISTISSKASARSRRPA